MGQFRTKVIEVKALQLNHENIQEIANWMAGDYRGHQTVGDANVLFLTINTANGQVEATEGNWILKDSEGKFYPCVDSVFKKKYEAV